MDRIYQDVLNRFKGGISAGRVVVLRELSGEAAKGLDAESLDWVYIDADHSYGAVQADLQVYWPLVKPGGAVAGDDYNAPGWWDGGVTRAVDEFVVAHRLALTVIGSQFLLRKPVT